MRSREIIVNKQRVIVYEDGQVLRIDSVYERVRITKTKGIQNKMRYMAICVGGKIFYTHRLVAEAFLDDFDNSLQVDHINGNPSDNRIENLRMVTNIQNNRAHKKNHGSVQFRGVYRVNRVKPYVSRVAKNGKQYYIGHFQTAEEAARAYDKKAIEFGFLPEALNFLDKQ